MCSLKEDEGISRQQAGSYGYRFVWTSLLEQTGWAGGHGRGARYGCRRGCVSSPWRPTHGRFAVCAAAACSRLPQLPMPSLGRAQGGGPPCDHWMPSQQEHRSATAASVHSSGRAVCLDCNSWAAGAVATVKLTRVCTGGGMAVTGVYDTCTYSNIGVLECCSSGIGNMCWCLYRVCCPGIVRGVRLPHKRLWVLKHLTVPGNAEEKWLWVCNCMSLLYHGVARRFAWAERPQCASDGAQWRPVESHSGAEGCSCKATLPSMFSGIDVTYQPCRKAVCCVVPLSPNVQRGVSMMISTSSQR